MCVVSNIGDYGRKQYWPNPFDDWQKWPSVAPVSPANPKVVPLPIPDFPYTPTPVDWEKELQRMKEFQELIEKARKYDEMTNEPDCEDPQKTDWLKDLEARVEFLEKNLPKKESTEDNTQELLLG